MPNNSSHGKFQSIIFDIAQKRFGGRGGIEIVSLSEVDLVNEVECKNHKQQLRSYAVKSMIFDRIIAY